MDVYTPCVQLNWEEYAKFIDNKRTTPYTGTTVLVDKDGYALAFSKSPLPLIRNESKAKEMFYLSPLRQHIGLYAYTFNALQQFVTWSVSTYEQNCIEGLEQMRFLENGMKMKVVHVDYRGLHGEVGLHGGVDSPEDVTRVERILAENLYPNCF